MRRLDPFSFVAYGVLAAEDTGGDDPWLQDLCPKCGSIVNFAGRDLPEDDTEALTVACGRCLTLFQSTLWTTADKSETEVTA